MASVAFSTAGSCHSPIVSDDDRAVMKRLAALEAEVKATRGAEQSAQARAAQALVVKQAPVKPGPAKPVRREDADDGDELGNALALAKRAHGVKQELTRAPQAGEKSWVKAGLLSMLLGPLGWLYAGSLREAIPASAAWLAFAALASKIVPMFLLMPVMFVALPLSGIAGAMYAVQYNRKGSRQRLFDKSKQPKQLDGT
jgi:hypothetical protein